MSVDIPPTENGEFESAFPSTPYYAIKMVDRVPKRKKLQTLRKTALGKTDGAKLVGESEIRKEIAIFKKVAHPNIVRMREIIDDPEQSKIFMILEYCEGGEIHWKEDDGSPALTVAETRRIFRDTLLGLEYRESSLSRAVLKWKCTTKGSSTAISSRAISCSPPTGWSRSLILDARTIPKRCGSPPLTPAQKATGTSTTSSWQRRRVHRRSLRPKCVTLARKTTRPGTYPP
jgi:hypothetical protein